MRNREIMQLMSSSFETPGGLSGYLPKCHRFRSGQNFQQTKANYLDPGQPTGRGIQLAGAHLSKLYNKLLNNLNSFSIKSHFHECSFYRWISHNVKLGNFVELDNVIALLRDSLW